MITNKAIQKKPDHKQMMQLQSWYEPALRTLDGLLEIRIGQIFARSRVMKRMLPSPVTSLWKR